jgi:D-glycero-alpha-D-manno-heptose 1-phosphate guanylyltransferase
LKTKKVDAIILAGGLGTRLRGVVRDVPKVLAPVKGRPFLNIILDNLHASGCVRTVVIAVGHMAEKIIEIYENNRRYGFNILFSREEALLGTGGAIKKALGLVKTDDVVALNGDSFIEVDLPDLIGFYRSMNSDMTIVLKELGNASRYGRVYLDEQQRIVAFREKSAEETAGYINGGIYLFNRKLFDGVEAGRVISLERELLPEFVKGLVSGYISLGKFIDIGIPEAYGIAQEYLKEEAGQGPAKR